MRKQILLFAYALLLGVIFGIIIWGFLRATSLSINLLWHHLPSQLAVPFYPILICAIGGLLIGIVQKRYGALPKDLPTVMEDAKAGSKAKRDNLYVLLLAAFLPLVFGGSLGPEAGLAGIIVALCFWISHKYKSFISGIESLGIIGIMSALSVIFASPIFGLIAPIEDSNNDRALPKSSKITLALAVIISSLGIMYILSSSFGGGAGIPRLQGFSSGGLELSVFIPLVIIGVSLGFLFNISGHLSAKLFNQVKGWTIVKAVLGGLILGTTAIFLPNVMFSGEHQMLSLLEANLPSLILILTGIAKLLITPLGISSGWRGGYIFPIIFSGLSIGLGLAGLLGICPIFASAIITSALVSVVIEKPLATALLLLIPFGAPSVPFLLASSFLATFVSSLPIFSRIPTHKH